MEGAGAGDNLFWLDYILVVVQFGLLGLGWFVVLSGLFRCVWRGPKTRNSSSVPSVAFRRRFVLCDHHYLRFAASFYGARVAAGASAAASPSPPPTTICLKPQPFFNIQR